MPLARELRDIARDLGLRGYSKMNKTALTDAIEGHVQHGKAEVKRSSPDADSDDEPVTVAVPTKPAPKQKRSSTSPWVQFCREHSKEQGISYKAAMSKKDEYLKWKDSRSTTLESVSEE
mgnify:FL=1|tara:strand:+ start:9628 stop:9984 length:357 start_codon:yes stop_codon:yes gene_type:complete